MNHETPSEFDEVSSCSSLLVDGNDESLLIDPAENMYLQTSVGKAMSQAIATLLESGEIDSTQAKNLESKFHETIYRIIRDSCRRSDAVLSATLDEYNVQTHRSLLKASDGSFTLNHSTVSCQNIEVVLSHTFSSQG